MEKKVLIIILAAFILRLLFLSPWLEDWDSVQFALGLRNFSVVDHQPHPPGYPLYILLGRVFNLFFQNDTKSLTALSALLGSLSLIPLYFLTRKMFDKKTAFLACLFLIFLPVHWVLSEIAISNIPGLFFLLTASYLIYNIRNSPKIIFFIGLCSGLFQGIRATDLPIYLSLLALIILRNRSLKFALLLLFSFILGISLWFIPTILITGPDKFFQASVSSANYVFWHDTLQGQLFSIPSFIINRVKNLSHLISIGYTPLFILITLPSIICTFKNKLFLKDFRYQFLGIWIFAYGILLLFFYNLELPQYTLPLSLPLVIFASLSFFILYEKMNFSGKKIITLSLAFIFINIFNNSFNQVKSQSITIPPTISPVLYVKENFNPEETIIITTFTYRQFQYYAPTFKNFYGAANAPKNIESRFVVIDYKKLQTQIPPLLKYKIISSKEYSQSLPFPRIHKTNLYILEKK